MPKSETLQLLVRLGYASRGVVYVMLGWLALQTRGKADDGSKGVFDWIQDAPLGEAILLVATLGLAAYALFKFASAFFDVQNRGNDKKALLKRVGDAASGIAHSAMAYAAFEFAMGIQNASSDDSPASQERASSVLELPLGWFLIGLLGLGFMVAAFMQARHAWDAHFMQRISANAPPFTCWIGRIGHAARAVVFVIIGWSLMTSAWFESENRVKAMGGAIGSLRDQNLLYMVVAIGLIAFGLFTLVVSRYRIIPDLDPKRVA